MKYQSYFLGGGMEDFLNFIRNITPCTILIMFAKIAIARELSGIHVFMAWVLIAIALYGAIASICLFLRKIHVHYRVISFSPVKGSHPDVILNTIMKTIEVVGLMMFILSILFFISICITLANKGANEYLLLIGLIK
ncbi:hypothetical protein H9Y13_12950 [Aeromonas veronii]|uniref:hypothetical protein n=1 Tax=Aeromonas TaxID=642 RepID=UPI0022EA811C|nr:MULTISPECIES: hypothetical protein [Aeromonas]KAJ8739017.1 hypothetical protein H9Y13_12950 [Aeromonas veronii]MDA3318347.1 hypothetical protein [Aeromonas sp. PI_26]